MVSISEGRNGEIRAKLVRIEQDIISDLVKGIKDLDPPATPPMKRGPWSRRGRWRLTWARSVVLDEPVEKPVMPVRRAI